MSLIYLDTGQLRELALHYDTKMWSPVDDLLKSNEYTLVISLMHLFEFSKWTGAIQDDPIAPYLDALDSIKWVPEPHKFFKLEARCAVDYLESGKRAAVSPLYDSFIDLVASIKDEKRESIPNVILAYDFKYDIKQPRTIPEIIAFLVKMKFSQKFDEQLEQDAVFVQKIRKEAAIWRNEKAVLASQIKAYIPQRTSTGSEVPSDDEYIAKLLTIADDMMPSLTFSTALSRIKFGNEEMKIEPNDFIDEYHASYLPYCYAAMLDRGTHGRCIQTKSKHAASVACKPDDFMKFFV